MFLAALTKPERTGLAGSQLTTSICETNSQRAANISLRLH